MDSTNDSLYPAMEYKGCIRLEVCTAIIDHEDRLWLWECRDPVSGGSVTECSQTGYGNEFDLPANFMCPANEYVAGVESYHDNGREDHRWKFTCCAISNRIAASCRQSGYVNDWDASIIFQANKGKVITGIFSYHDNVRE